MVILDIGDDGKKIFQQSMSTVRFIGFSDKNITVSGGAAGQTGNLRSDHKTGIFAAGKQNTAQCRTYGTFAVSAGDCGTTAVSGCQFCQILSAPQLSYTEFSGFASFRVIGRYRAGIDQHFCIIRQEIPVMAGINCGSGIPQRAALLILSGIGTAYRYSPCQRELCQRSHSCSTDTGKVQFFHQSNRVSCRRR